MRNLSVAMSSNSFRLTTAPLQFVRYEVCTLHSEFNEHSVLTLQGMIDEEQVSTFLQATEQLCVLHYINEDVEIIWHGIVKEMTLSKAAGQTIAHVRIVGKTCLADAHNQTRTFKGTQQSLQQLSDQMADPNLPKLYGEKANADIYAPYLIQYEETNWQFLKRQAAKQQIPLIAEEMDGYVELTTDVQEHSRRYEFGISDHVTLQNTAVTLSTLPLANKTQQRQFETNIYALGERLQIETNDYIICAKTMELQHLPSLHVVYELKTEQALIQHVTEHPLAQQTLQATILHTNDSMHLGRVAVRFDWEQEQDVEARLLPFATPFTAQQIGFHALPEPGERVYVLFRTHEEVEAFVYLAERTQPNNRLTNEQQIWRTAKGVEILLGEQLVKLTIPDEHQSAFTLQEQAMRLHFQQREIELTTEKITIKDAHNQVTLTKDGIELMTGEQSIRMQQQALELQSGNSSIILSADGIILKGTTIELQSTNDLNVKSQRMKTNVKQVDLKSENLDMDIENNVKLKANQVKIEANNTYELESSKVKIKSKNVSIG